MKVKFFNIKWDTAGENLKSWLAEMKNDPSYIFKASTQASKVTDYLLSFVQEPVEEEIAS